MKKYIIVAESGADLSREVIDTYDIRIVQMHVEFDGKDHFDNDVTMPELAEFFERTGKVPKTAGVNPQQYEEVFERIKREDPGAIVLHLCYSAVLSVGFQSSIQADDGSLTIYRIDTKNVSIGQGIIVTQTAELIAQRPDIEPEELLPLIDAMISGARFSFIPGNLAFLRAGGRVSNAQYIGATLLKLNPLIEVIDGYMLSTKKHRGNSFIAFQGMLKEYFQKYTIEKKQVFCVNAGDLDRSIMDMIEATVKAAGVREMIWHRAGGVISTHSGPGGFGIAGFEV